MKRFSVLMSVLLILNMILSPLMPNGTIFAESIGLDMRASMKVNGITVDTSKPISLTPGTKISFRLDYSVTNNGTKPKEGDILTFKLPEVFRGITPAYPENHFKDMKVDGTTVTLVCGENIDTAIGGYLTIDAVVGETDVEIPGDIIIEINGSTIVIDTTIVPPDAVDRTIDKRFGNGDKDHTINPDQTGAIVGQEVDYSVAINEKYTLMENAVFTDTIPAGMELIPNSIVVKKVVNGVQTDVTNEVAITPNASQLTIQFGEVIHHKHIVTYKTKVTEVKENYVNDATIKASNTDPISDSVVATPKPDEVTTNTDISKAIDGDTTIEPDGKGSLVGKQVSYQVVVNGNKTNKPNAIFTDTIPAGMKLIPGSVKIVKEERGTSFDVTNALAAATIKEDNLLQVTFGDITTQYTVTYKTEIIKDKDAYANDANIVWDGGSKTATTTSKPNKPTPGTGSIDKTVNGKENTTVRPDSDGNVVGKEFDYRVLVNNEMTEKENLTLTDTIPTGMGLVTDSVKVYKAISPTQWMEVTKDVTVNASSSKLAVEFGTTSDKYKVEYKTKITSFQEKYENKATISYDGKENSDSAIVTTDKEGPIGTTDLTKKVVKGANSKLEVTPNNDGTYTGKKINYEVVVNDKFASKPNAVFIDKIPAGMELVENSVKVVKYDRYGSSQDVTKSLGNNIEKSASQLKITFGGIKDKYVITYQTNITEYKPDGWKNDATLTWNGGSAEEDVTVKPTPPNPGPGNLSKDVNNKSILPDETGSYIGKKLTYTVIVNNELTEKPNLTMIDTMPAGTKLVVDMVKVYRDTGNKYEDITNKGIVTINKTEQQLKVNFGTTNMRYKVTYEIEVTANKDIYANKVEATWDGGENNVTSTSKPEKPKPGSNDKLSKTVNDKGEITEDLTSNFVGKEFTYKLLVNDKLVEKQNAVLTDTLPAGMELVPNSIQIKKDYGGGVYGDVTKNFTITTTSNSFKIDFGTIKDRYIVTYKGKITKIVEEGYVNEATLTYGDNIIDVATARINIDDSKVTPGEDDKLIKKSATNGTVSEIGDRVDYKVTINEEKKRLLDVVFEDKIPTGMKLIPSSVVIKENGKDVTAAMKDKITATDNGLIINIGETFNTYEITYSCEVTALKAKYENSAKITAKDIIRETENTISYEVSAGGMNATKTVNKSELKEGDNQEVVYSIKVWSSAVFPADYLNIVDELDERVIYKGYEAPDSVDVSYDAATHTVKVINTKDIPPADKANSLEIKLKVSFEKVQPGTTIENVAKINDTGTPPVEVKKGYAFEALKVDINNNNAPLEHAEFNLYKVDNEQFKFIKRIISDENGKLASELPGPGEYALIEMDAPFGYILSQEPIFFDVTDKDIGTTVHLKNPIENYRIPSTINVQKVDEKYQNVPLKGAQFTLFKDGKAVHTAETSPLTGKATFDDVKPGTYILKETKAPEGYLLSKEEKVVTVFLGGAQTLNFKFTNKYNGQEIQVKKVDSIDSSRVLEGAEFTIKSNGQVVKTITTGENGLASTNLPIGSYTIQETKAPEGYNLSGEVKAFEVKEATNTTLAFTFTNEQTPGAAELIKVDKDNNNQPIEGAVFKVVGSDKETVVRENLTTNETGKITVDNLKPGTYYFVETQAAAGYILDETPIKFEVVFNQQQMVSVTFENEQTPGSAELIKVDKDNSNQPIEGAVFKVVAADKETVVRENLTTNEAGKVTVDNLKPGTYYFIETKAAAGYVLDETPIQFEVVFNQQEVVSVTFDNEQMPGSTELVKVDKDNNAQPIEGAVFKVVGADKETVVREDLTTDEAGKITVNDLKPGTYYFVETQAAGYILDETPIQFEVAFNQQEIATVTFENEQIPGSAELVKVDKDNNAQPIEGAVFKVVGADKETVVREDLTTDEAGKITVNDLKPGTYYFVETQAAVGYILDEKPIQFEVAFNQQEVVSVTFENEQTPGSVELIKVDKDNNAQPIEGAVFKLVGDDKEAVIQENVTTDEAGKIKVDNLKPGTYYFVETQAAPGYVLDETPIKFEVVFNQQQMVSVTFENEQTPGSAELVKVDKDNNAQTIEGAVFKVVGADKETVVRENLTTNETGKIKVDNLKPGTYYFVETQAAVGYILDETPVQFEVVFNQQEVVSVTFENEQIPGTLEITKTDVVDGKLLANAEFAIRNEAGEVVATGVTNENGVATFPDLACGKYTYEETKAPEGYIINNTKYPFEIKENGEVVKVNMTNERKPITPGETPTTPTKPITPSKPDGDKDSDTPYTGDDGVGSNLFMLVVSSLALLGITFGRKRIKKEM